MSAEDILSNAHISLYALDFENSQAVFVATSPETDLSQAPFYDLAQYENALCVITLPFDGAELSRHLQAHAYIRTPVFEAPNTWKL